MAIPSCGRALMSKRKPTQPKIHPKKISGRELRLLIIYKNEGQAEVRKRRTIILGLFAKASFILCGTLLSLGIGFAQTRDHLTDQETDLVRYHQELDKRIDVFIKAIDRRFAIINNTAQLSVKKKDKDEPDWGDLPKGSHADLLGDIAGILDEAISNIDDVSRRDEKNPLISRALRKLTAATRGYVDQLTALKNQSKDPDESSAIDRALDNANQIIEAGSKLPAPSADENKKKKKP